MTQISQLDNGEAPRLRWRWSHALGGDYAGAHTPPGEAAPFLSTIRRRRVIDALRASYEDEVFLSWMLSITEIPSLEAVLADIPDRFRDLCSGRD